jgi:hypothetical protein
MAGDFMNKKLFERINNNVHRGEDISLDIPDFKGDYFKVISVFSVSRDYVKDTFLKSIDEIGELNLNDVISLNYDELELLTDLYENHINLDANDYHFSLIIKPMNRDLKIKYFAFKKDKKVRQYKKG